MALNSTPCSGSDPSSLLSFMNATSSNIQEALAKPSKTKRKINHSTFIRKGVKRLNNGPKSNRVTKSKSALQHKQATDLTVPPPTQCTHLTSPLRPSENTPCFSWPSLDFGPPVSAYSPLPPTCYHQDPEPTLYANYPSPPKQKAIDPELESLLSELDFLDSPGSLSRRGSDTILSNPTPPEAQATIGEHSFSDSYSECSDEYFEDSTYCSPYCSPSNSNSVHGFGSPIRHCVVNAEWVATNHQDTINLYVPPDQGLPMTPTITQIMDQFACPY